MNQKDGGNKGYKPKENQEKTQDNKGSNHQGYKGKPDSYNKPKDGGYGGGYKNNYDNTQRSDNKNKQYQGYNNDRQDSYKNKPRDGGYGGYKNNYEESKQTSNTRPATAKNNPKEDQGNFKEEFKEYFEEVKQYELKMEQFNKNPGTIDGYYYLLSNKALREWKDFIDYQNIIADKRPTISVYLKPQKVNEDLVSDDKAFLAYPNKQDPCSVVLKPTLELGKDFTLVDEEVWTFFQGKYGGVEIKRKGVVNDQGKVELVKSMHVISLVFVYSNWLRTLESNNKEQLKMKKLQVPFELSVKSFKSTVAKIFNKMNVFKYNLESTSIRLWKLDPAFADLEAFRLYLHDSCVKSRSYDYQITFNGQLLDRDASNYLEEINPELKDPFIIEINQPGKLWIFFNDLVKACKKCDFCGSIDFLDYACVCGRAAYCSEFCKYSDKGSHAKKCEKTYDSDENKEVVPAENPINGLAGLENLGNTCYMNCSIQCLSNIAELTEYFLSQKYKQEINEQNPLGTKGKIVKKYAYLVKKLWLENKRDFAPYSLKLAIAKYQPIFQGQHQHDAQEFLFYLLDTIHEDLNRVMHKPLTEPVEAGNKTDLEVGRESWEIFLKRNQSVIVDLMYGQFKSTIQCSVCNNVSKSFESFSICSVPIPNQKEIEVILVHESYKKKPYRILFKYPDNNHKISDLKVELAALMKKSADSLQLGIGDRNGVTPLHNLDVPTHEIGHQLGKNYLFIFELTPEEMMIPPSQRVFIGFQTIRANYAGQPKEPVGVAKLLAIDKNMTNKEVHLKLFSKYRFQFDESWPYKSDKPYETYPLEKACDEAFRKSILYDVVLTFVSVDKTEQGILEYNDEKFSEILKRYEEPEKQLLLQVEWKNIPSFIDLDFFKSYLRHDPYKDGVQTTPTGEKRFVDITDCLNSFAEPEELDENNAWYCKKCTKHQNAIKKLELYKAPKIFIMHFKRFKTGDNTRWNRTESKIRDLITYPVENFDLSPFVNNPHLPSDYFGKELNGEGMMNGSKEELRYDLIGVVHHVGTLNSGHYITHCRNYKTGDWYLYDDERVRKVENPHEIVDGTAYILFYRRKD